MKFVFFCHSLLSDWNHGNAHFLRGIVSELQDRGHQLDVYEPADGWSLTQLKEAHGIRPLQEICQFYPDLPSHSYRPDRPDLDLMPRHDGKSRM